MMVFFLCMTTKRRGFYTSYIFKEKNTCSLNQRLKDTGMSVKALDSVFIEEVGKVSQSNSE